MKQFKRILCFALTILMVCTLMAAAAPVRAAGGSVDMGDVIQLGDWSCPNLHIVFYPEALETSNDVWPVIVWSNGTCCAPVLYTELLKDLAAEGFAIITFKCDTLDAFLRQREGNSTVQRCTDKVQ